jgi:type I restriction enzyme S subunit
MTSPWRIARTSDLIEEGHLEIGDGYRAKNVEFGPSGIPFARVQNIQSGFQFDSVDLFPISDLGRVGPKVSQPGDSVITTKGSVGRVAFVFESTPRFVYSPQLSYWRSKSRELLDPMFLRYWLQGPEFLNQCASVKGATDMADYVNLRDQRRMSISIPPVQSQKTIASILSAYDDLIENNSRRIEILEEMAQAIYREWFVEFRYPGHEDVPLVDSELGPIPEGWEVRSLFEIAEATFGFPFGSEFFNTAGEGTPVIRIRDVAKNLSGTWTSEEFEGRYRVENGDLLVGMDGEFHMCKWAGGIAALNQRVVRFRPRHGIGRYELFQALRGPISDLNRMIVGTTVAHLGKRHLEQIQIVVPNPEIQTKLVEPLESMFQLELNLRTEIQVLRETRDLLLPRLISGEIDVSELDIELADSSV